MLRFWNNDILENRAGVLQTITEALGPWPSIGKLAASVLKPVFAVGFLARGARGLLAFVRLASLLGRLVDLGAALSCRDFLVVRGLRLALLEVFLLLELDFIPDVEAVLDRR